MNPLHSANSLAGQPEDQGHQSDSLGAWGDAESDDDGDAAEVPDRLRRGSSAGAGPKGLLSEAEAIAAAPGAALLGTSGHDQDGPLAGGTANNSRSSIVSTGATTTSSSRTSTGSSSTKNSFSVRSGSGSGPTPGAARLQRSGSRGKGSEYLMMNGSYQSGGSLSSFASSSNCNLPRSSSSSAEPPVKPPVKPPPGSSGKQRRSSRSRRSDDT